MEQKKLSAGAARELKELQKASFGDSGGELGRRTGEKRGGVKESIYNTGQGCCSKVG